MLIILLIFLDVDLTDDTQSPSTHEEKSPL